MGMSIYVYKTKSEEKDILKAFKGDRDAFIDKYTNSYKKWLKRLENSLKNDLMYKEEYKMFLSYMKKHYPRVYNNEFYGNEVYGVSFLNTILMSWERKLDFEKAYFRKFYLLYDYCLDKGLMGDKDYSCWIKKNNALELIKIASESLESSFVDYYEIDEYKYFIKEMKKLVRYWNNDERVYIIFDA